MSRSTLVLLREEAETAADFCEGLLDVLNYEGDIEITVKAHYATINLLCPNSSQAETLIGYMGFTLSSLQYLMRLYIQKELGEYSPVTLDVNSYMRKRKEDLDRIICDAIARVEETSEPVDLEPMDARKRKRVHKLVHKAGLRSSSHGEEPHRYVTISLPRQDSEFFEENED